MKTSNVRTITCEKCGAQTTWEDHQPYPSSWHPLKRVDGKLVACDICPLCWVKPEPEYRGIGESDKRIAELEGLLDVATKQLVIQGQKVMELTERLAEVDSWKCGMVPKGIDTIQYKYWWGTEEKDGGIAYRSVAGSYIDRFYITQTAYLIPSRREIQWRPLKEGE
jgi:hypothetical protein